MKKHSWSFVNNHHVAPIYLNGPPMAFIKQTHIQTARSWYMDGIAASPQKPYIASRLHIYVIIRILTVSNEMAPNKYIHIEIQCLFISISARGSANTPIPSYNIWASENQCSRYRLLRIHLKRRRTTNLYVELVNVVWYILYIYIHTLLILLICGWCDL